MKILGNIWLCFFLFVIAKSQQTKKSIEYASNITKPSNVVNSNSTNITSIGPRNTGLTGQTNTTNVTAMNSTTSSSQVSSNNTTSVSQNITQAVNSTSQPTQNTTQMINATSSVQSNSTQLNNSTQAGQAQYSTKNVSQSSYSDSNNDLIDKTDPNYIPSTFIDKYGSMKIDYSQHGKNWSPNYCNEGSQRSPVQQSPINIETSKVLNNTILGFNLTSFSNNASTFIEIIGEGSIIFVNFVSYNFTSNESIFSFYNEQGEKEYYHKDYMLWKVPSEHAIDGRQLSAELQVYFIQRATNKQIAIAFLFDTELAINVKDVRRLKTCFVDSFEFEYYNQCMSAKPPRDPGYLQMPLKEFMKFLPDQYFFYHGSQTIPDCDESVMWIIAKTNHVITEDQVAQIKKTLSPEVQSVGGNWRDIQPLEDRKVYQFSNSQNNAYQLTQEQKFAQLQNQQQPSSG